jgi:serpin B
MKNTVIFVASVVIILAIGFGAYYITNNNIPGQSQVPQIPARTINIREATTTEIASVVNANNQFAFDLYSRYSSKDGNIFFSPYSITSALAMTYEGARGQTATEMEKVLHFQDETGSRRVAIASIYDDLNAKDKPFALKTSNALWVEKTFTLLPDYISTVANYYGGLANNLDFRNNPEASRVKINTWVADQTNNLIQNLIPQGLIRNDTSLVLTNAIYFKGLWDTPFKPEKTQKEDFSVNPNKVIKTDMMSISGKAFPYMETEKTQILTLPYKGKELSMTFVLPKKGYDLFQIEQTLTSITHGGSSKVDIFIPKFKLQTEYLLKENLETLGMPTAFSSVADFSGMTGKNDLCIGEVIHKAFVEVDEAGTKAAAATAVIMMPTSAGPGSWHPTPVFRADHPFIFFIENNKTGEILFMGRVNNPIP